MVTMYDRGFAYCRNCGPPDKGGEWKPPSRVKHGHCLDCGSAVRFSPKDSVLKAILRRRVNKYSALRPSIVKEAAAGHPGQQPSRRADAAGAPTSSR